MFVAKLTMAMKTKVSLAIFLFFLLALCSNLAIGTEETEMVDPELKTCKHQCKQQRQYSEGDKRICMQRCDKYHKTKQEREKQMEGEEEENEAEDENPYVFQDEDFDTRVDAEDGRLLVLQNFTKKSNLLRDVQNYGLAILEANAHALMSPHHFDSEAIFFNAKGRAIIGLVLEDKTERVNLEPGDIMRIPAGTPIYVVNRDENEKLFLAMLHIPVSTPVNFEAFFGPGGRNPESVLTAFSSKVLEAAYKTPHKKLERLFDQQKEERIFKIPREAVQALAPKRSIWPFGGQSNPFNLFSKGPSFSNQYGRLFEVGSSDKKSGLQGLNLLVTLANITKNHHLKDLLDTATKQLFP